MRLLIKLFFIFSVIDFPFMEYSAAEPQNTMYCLTCIFLNIIPHIL